MSSSKVELQVISSGDTTEYTYRFPKTLFQDGSLRWLLAAILVGYALSWGLQIVARAFDIRWMQATADFFWYNGAMTKAFWHGEFWRPVTSGFLHNGIPHLIFNLLNLAVLARLCQEVFARRSWLILFVGSQAMGAIAASIIAPEQAVVGASIGMMGLYRALITAAIRYLKFSAADIPANGLPALKNLVLWLGLCFLVDYLIPNVSHSAHLCGLISGMLIASVLPINMCMKIFASRLDLIELTDVETFGRKRRQIESITFVQPEVLSGDWLVVVQRENGMFAGAQYLDLIGESPDLDLIIESTLVADEYSAPSYFPLEVLKNTDEETANEEKSKTPIRDRLLQIFITIWCWWMIFNTVGLGMIVHDTSSLNWLHCLPAPLDGFAIFIGCRLGSLISTYILAYVAGDVMTFYFGGILKRLAERTKKA